MIISIQRINSIVVCLLMFQLLSCSKKEETQKKEEKLPFDFFIVGEANKDGKSTYFYYKNDSLVLGNTEEHSYTPIDYHINNGNVYVLTAEVGKNKEMGYYKNDSLIFINKTYKYIPSAIRSFNDDVYILLKDMTLTQNNGMIWKNGKKHQELTKSTKNMEFSHLHIDENNLYAGATLYENEVTVSIWQNGSIRKINSGYVFNTLRGLNSSNNLPHIIINSGNSNDLEVGLYIRDGPAQNLNTQAANDFVCMKKYDNYQYILAYESVAKHQHKIKYFLFDQEVIARSVNDEYAPFDITVYEKDIYILARSTRNPSKSIILKNGEVFKEFNAESGSVKLFPIKIEIVKNNN